MDRAIVEKPRCACHLITLPPILQLLCFNEAGLVVQAGQLGHQLSFNAGIIADSVVTSIMKSGASIASIGSICEVRYKKVMIIFFGYYISWLGGTQEGGMQLIGQIDIVKKELIVFVGIISA